MIDTHVILSAVDFADENFGVIAGELGPIPVFRIPSVPLRPRTVLPGASRSVPQEPWQVVEGVILDLTRTVLLTTTDGGKTWQQPVPPVSGRFTRVRLTPAGTGLLAMESPIGAKSWLRDRLSSIVAGIGSPRGAAPKVESPAGRMVIEDVHLAANGTMYLAGYEPPGELVSEMGKLKVLRSTDGRNWSEMPMPMDSAVAPPLVLAGAGDDLWLATWLGVIMKLVKD